MSTKPSVLTSDWKQVKTKTTIEKVSNIHYDQTVYVCGLPYVGQFTSFMGLVAMVLEHVYVYAKYIMCVLV